MSPPRPPLAPKLYLVAGTAALSILATMAFLGWDYYRLGPSERPFHPVHAGLRPSGRLGLVLAISGTVLIFLNLTYLAKKRWSFLRPFGVLRSWMAFHAFTGIVGPGLIIIHTAFSARNSTGTLSLAALLVVVLTGLIGRYIYARVPRSVEGHELEYDEARRRLAGSLDELEMLGVEVPPLPPRGRLDLEEDRGLSDSIAVLLKSGARRRQEYAQIRKAVLASAVLRHRAGKILPLVRRMAKERVWLERFHELRSLMGSWRFFHRWLALVMLLVLLSHIFLAVKFGDLWFLKGKP